MSDHFQQKVSILPQPWHNAAAPFLPTLRMTVCQVCFLTSNISHKVCQFLRYKMQVAFLLRVIEMNIANRWQTQLLVLWKQILPFPTLKHSPTQNSVAVNNHSWIQLQKVIMSYILVEIVLKENWNLDKHTALQKAVSVRKRPQPHLVHALIFN